MSLEWIKRDDTTYMLLLGKALMIGVVYDHLSPAGWKVQVGLRSLKDKFASLENAKKVAVAFAEKVLQDVRADMEAVKAQEGQDTGAPGA